MRALPRLTARMATRLMLLALATMMASAEAFASMRTPPLRTAASLKTHLSGARRTLPQPRASERGLEMTICCRTFNRASFKSYLSRTRDSGSGPQVKRDIAEVPHSLDGCNRADAEGGRQSASKKELRMD